MRFSDEYHADPCRGCRQIEKRSTMTSAAKVLSKPGARGWFCSSCVARRQILGY